MIIISNAIASLFKILGLYLSVLKIKMDRWRLSAIVARSRCFAKGT